MSTTARRVILIELSVADAAVTQNDIATELVVERCRQVMNPTYFVAAADSAAPPLIEADKRDIEAEQRISESARPVLEAIARRAAAARTHATQAVDEAQEAVRLVKIEAHLRAEAMLTTVVSECFDMIGRYVPDGPDVVKEMIKNLFWVGACAAWVHIAG